LEDANEYWAFIGLKDAGKNWALVDANEYWSFDEYGVPMKIGL
jgi:hypothetical protein